jgi:hypothetical protein
MRVLPAANPAIVAVYKMAAVPVDVLSRVWGEVEFSFDVCRAVNNAHNELQ